MAYEWVDAYLSSKESVTKEHKEAWEADVYKLGGKMIAMNGYGDADKRRAVTVKLDPAHAQTLRRSYKEVIAGYHMNKEHWSTLFLDGDVPDDVLKQMLDESYELVLSSFSRKKQAELMGDRNLRDNKKGHKQ